MAKPQKIEKPRAEWGSDVVVDLLKAFEVEYIAINPGADVHWGICTSIWGTPDLDDLPRKPGIPVVAVNNPDGQELTPEARARLATLADHTELGTGFAIAMRDLEIRGAGDRLRRLPL